MIAVIDYGIGNLASVVKAVKTITSSVVVTSDFDEIESAEKLILPGVGAYGDAVDALESTGLKDVIRKRALGDGTPLLGICLGMQLLGLSSEESPDKRGLELINFHVKGIRGNPGLKVPHVGWNTVRQSEDGVLFSGVPKDSDFYFVHSYCVYPDSIPSECAIAVTEYGQRFVCAVRKSNIIGYQFHPEKSQKVGLSLLKNFVEI